MPVMVGAGYSDLIPPGGRLELNRFRHKTELNYSDSLGPLIYDLPKLREIESLDRVVTLSNISDRDVEQIAELEMKSYPPEMRSGREHIQSVLFQQRELNVPGSASSFLIRKGGVVSGYCLLLPEKSRFNDNETVAHIYDMAVLPEFRGTSLGTKMMEQVVNMSIIYGAAIEVEARASTSYPILVSEKSQRWFESKGFFLSTIEKLPDYLGGEDFYFLRFDFRGEAVYSFPTNEDY